MRELCNCCPNRSELSVCRNKAWAEVVDNLNKLNLRDPVDSTIFMDTIRAMVKEEINKLLKKDKSNMSNREMALCAILEHLIEPKHSNPEVVAEHILTNLENLGIVKFEEPKELFIKNLGFEPAGQGSTYVLIQGDRAITSHFCSSDNFAYIDLYKHHETKRIIGDMSLEDFRKVRIER